MKDLKIISGGQTGVDRGALDAALAAGAPCGGWCPEGREAEDGPIPDRYPVEVLAGAGYRDRTRANVEAADATLIVHFDELEGGTALTVEDCRELHRPHLIVNAAAEPVDRAAERLRGFVGKHAVKVLNVAGPRASKWAEGAEVARAIVGGLLSRRA